MCMIWNKSSNSKFTLFISQYFPNWFLCIFSNRALSLEVSWFFCHTVMVGHLISLYLQSKKCTNIILDILKVMLMPFAVFWLMASFRWYVHTYQRIVRDYCFHLQGNTRRVRGMLLQLFILFWFKTFNCADYSSWRLMKMKAAFAFETLAVICLCQTTWRHTTEVCNFPKWNLLNCVLCQLPSVENKGGFTHSMPCPCRSPAMPCVNSHTPCRATALLRECCVLRESPRGSRKHPNC
jgi:hypothetical protein